MAKKKKTTDNKYSSKTKRQARFLQFPSLDLLYIIDDRLHELAYTLEATKAKDRHEEKRGRPGNQLKIKEKSR